MATYLVTGAAGFIGYHVSSALLARGDRVVGLDSMSAYYDVGLKKARVDRLAGRDGFEFRRIDLASEGGMERLFGRQRIDGVVHLAAQAGVRHSLVDPRAYVQSNVAGTLNVLEGCRHAGIGNLVLASSSSVYGLSRDLPYEESGDTNRPASLYAATKKSCEAMAHAYSHLFGIPCTAVRFFTVYGPWGRPDMAYYKFALAIARGTPVEIFGDGTGGRDMTYVDDCVEGVLRLLASPPAAGAAGAPPLRTVNVGRSDPVTVIRLVESLERLLGRPAKRVHLPAQAGDVENTSASVDRLQEITGMRPETPFDTGIMRFVEWFREYHAADLAG